MKERMDELLKNAEENNCKEEFLKEFYRVMSFAIRQDDFVSSKNILSHAEWVLDCTKK